MNCSRIAKFRGYDDRALNYLAYLVLIAKVYMVMDTQQATASTVEKYRGISLLSISAAPIIFTMIFRHLHIHPIYEWVLSIIVLLIWICAALYVGKKVINSLSFYISLALVLFVPISAFFPTNYCVTFGECIF